MHPLDQLETELQTLRVATNIDPQDKERIQDCVDAVENAYASDSLPSEWTSFKTQLERVLDGVRDSVTTQELISVFQLARDKIDQ